MDWRSIAGPLAEVGGGMLGSIIGGPLGNAVGQTVGKAVADALGVEPKPEAVAEAIATDPAAPEKVQELQTQRYDEWASLEAEGLKLMGQLVEGEKKEGFFAWGWRPAMSWLIGAIILQTFIVAPWVRGAFGLDVGTPYEQVLGIAAVWLTVYGGGHTAKAIFAKGAR